MTEIRLKRAYASQAPEDGFRVYVDRLWPRGLSHETFHYDLWDKDIAPSTELREWYHVAPTVRWNDFAQRYANELHSNPAYTALVSTLSAHPCVTLLFSSHDTLHNNAVVLANTLASEPGFKLA